MEVTRADIEEAEERIRPYLRMTPVLEVEPNLFLKLEQTQRTGSFKVRGAFSFLTARPDAQRVVAASGGTHGLAVAFAATTLGRQADIFVPTTSPESKIGRIRETGARLHEIEGYYDEALDASRRYLQSADAVEVHAFDDPLVVAGQGTCGKEISEQIPDLDTVVVAVGGGGLIGGIASWVRDDARVVAAETATTNALGAALREGRPTDVEVGGLAADSLGARRVGEIAFEAAQRWVDEAVTVEDPDVEKAQRWLWREARLVAEPGAATALAAVLSGAYRTGSGERVCVVISGANTDPASVI